MIQSKIASVEMENGWRRKIHQIFDIENWFNATPYGHLEDAINAIGTNEATLLISNACDIGQRYLEIPPNVTLQFLRGGLLHFDLGGTFEITKRSLIVKFLLNGRENLVIGH